METILGNYHISPASMGDAKEVVELIVACDIAEFGVPDFTLEDLLDVWEELPLKTNTWIIRIKGDSGVLEKLVGYGFMEERNEGRLDCYGYVHPDYKGNGIGSVLVKCFEVRGEEYVKDYKSRGIPYAVNNIIPAGNKAAISLLERKGFTFERLHSRMSIDLDEPGSGTVVIDGIEIMPYLEIRDRFGVFETYVEAFKDTREYASESMEAFYSKRTGKDFDQSLWKVAYLGDDLVGFILCEIIPEGVYVDLLGVKRKGRKRGIGLALLQQVFSDSYEKGYHNVSLSVDANSLTNANRLYEKAGMKPIFQIAVYSRK